MSTHDSEYRDLLAQVMQHDQDSITAHWDLGELFARYGEPVTGIAQAISRSVTYVSDHLKIVRLIPTREALARILENRDDIGSWTVLVAWVKAGGPGQDSDDDPDANEIARRRNRGGLQLQVPATVIKGLADLGANPREALDLFWRNASPQLIVSVAYPALVSSSGGSS